MKNEFDHRNLWLQVVLGLLSAGERLERMLNHHAPAHPAEQPDGSPPAPAEAADEVLMAFVLGLVGSKAHLHEVLERAATDGGAPNPEPPDPPPPSHSTFGSFLR